MDQLAILLAESGGQGRFDELASALLQTGSLAPARRVLQALLESDSRFRVEEGLIVLQKPPEAPADLPLHEAEFAVLDFETNGLAQGERAIEIGLACYRAGEEIAHFHTLLDPGTRIAPFVQSLTGIRPEDLAGMPPFEEAWRDAGPLMEGRVLVAHNLPFDGRILKHELSRIGARHSPPASLCTVRLARRLLPRDESKSLDALAGRFALEFVARHRALDDARVTGKVLYRLLDLAAERAPMETLGHLHHFLHSPLPRKKPRPRAPGEGRLVVPGRRGGAEGSLE